MKFGEQIRKCRTQQSLTQQDAADYLHVTRQTISNWENGKSYPDLNMLLTISDLYHVSVDALLREDSELMDFLDRGKVVARFTKLNRVINIIVFLITVLALALFMSPAVGHNKLINFLMLTIISALLVLMLIINRFYNFIARPSARYNLFTRPRMALFFSIIALLTIVSLYSPVIGKNLLIGIVVVLLICNVIIMAAHYIEGKVIDYKIKKYRQKMTKH